MLHIADIQKPKLELEGGLRWKEMIIESMMKTEQSRLDNEK